jgi:hypothetical protein
MSFLRRAYVATIIAAAMMVVPAMAAADSVKVKVNVKHNLVDGFVDGLLLIPRFIYIIFGGHHALMYQHAAWGYRLAALLGFIICIALIGAILRGGISSRRRRL